jgi:hypothetical protein
MRVEELPADGVADLVGLHQKATLIFRGVDLKHQVAFIVAHAAAFSVASYANPAP